MGVLRAEHAEHDLLKLVHDPYSLAQGAQAVARMWVVVKIMVPFWVP